MAKTVNYAGTVLGLNTDKYSKSLKSMKAESSSVIKSIQSNFKSLAVTFAGIFASKKAFDSIVSSLKDYEAKVSSLSAITGSLADAKVMFSDLNNLSRKIPQSFDEITAAAVNLNKAGIAPTEQNLKALASIAVGTNKSLAEIAQTVSAASLGQLKSLRQLGITAEQTGDKIELTYKGQKSTIEATNTAIMEYVKNLANTKFADSLKFQMSGMTGATKNLSDAWSDMWTAIATGDVGKEIASMIYEASRALDSFTAVLKSPAIQQSLGGIVRAFRGAFTTIANGLSNLWQPFADFFENLSDTGSKTCKAQIGYFEGWFDFVRLGLGDLTSLLDTWWKQLQAYAERAGAIIAETTHGTTYEVMNRADLSVKMLSKIKELGLENTALVKKSGKVDLSAILQLPKGHPLLDYYMTERQRVTEANKGIKDTAIASETAFQQRLTDIEKKNNQDRNAAYDKLIADRTSLIDSLKTKAIEYKDTMTSVGRITGGASGSTSKLSAEVDKARKAYESLKNEIQSMKFNALDAIEQENSTYADRMTVLKTALEQSAITQEQYRSTEQELTQLHLDKLSELYSEHYKEEAEKRNQALQEMKQREEDWNSDSTVLDQFSEKIAKYNLNWANLISGDFGKAKLTGTQIVGVYSQAGKAISDYFGSVAQGFEKNSGIYKGLFALQKGFAVASSMISMYQGAMNAMAAPYPANLIAWAQVIGQGLQIISQLKSVNYSGAYDNGGYIPSGAVGLVGEIGPELVRGPATVTGRKDTEDLMKNNGSNVTVNLIEDASRAGQVQQRTDNDQQTIIDVIVANIRNGGEVANAMSGTYGLARQGY